MVPREILKSPRFLRVAVPAALGLLLALLLLAVGCPGEKERLRHRVQRLEREKKAAQASAARWKAESQAKDQSMISFASLILEVGNRIDQIQQDQQGLTALTTQSRGDSWRIVKDKSIPPALDRIDQQLRKNREQIGQLEVLVSRKSTENQVLQAVIERFKRQDEALEQQLVALRRSTGALSKKVKTLETTVVKLADEVGQKEKAIDEKEKVIGEQETQLTEKNRQLYTAS
jgi:predicted  nucleic acid-binding Zn-ribbon protein